MNLQRSDTSHTIHPTVCVTHEPTTVRYKSHNPSNCLCHSWTYNRQVQVTQSIQLSVSLMNLQPLGTSHTIHPTVCVTHEPTTVRYKSHNPSNCLCHSWTYNRQIQVTQSIQLSVSLMNLQPSGTSHTIHPTVCVTHEPTTIRYKSHNPSNCLCHSWTYNRQVQVTQLHPTVCVTHEPTTIRYKSHNPSNCLCHSWTYNRQVQVTQSIQLSVSLMNLQPSGTSHTTPSNCLCHSWTYNHQVQVTQLHPTVCVTHEPTTVRYKSHNSIQLSVSLMKLQPSGTSHTTPSNCLCHSWTYSRQVQVTQSIQMYMSVMNLQPSGTSHTIHSTACVTSEPTTIRYKSYNSIQMPCATHECTTIRYKSYNPSRCMSLMNLQPSGTSHTIHSTACATHEPTTVRYKSHNPSNCLCHSWTYNRQVQVT